jgi:hypothetical protein
MAIAGLDETTTNFAVHPDLYAPESFYYLPSSRLFKQPSSSRVCFGMGFCHEVRRDSSCTQAVASAEVIIASAASSLLC